MVELYEGTLCQKKKHIGPYGPNSEEGISLKNMAAGMWCVPAPFGGWARYIYIIGRGEEHVHPAPTIKKVRRRHSVAEAWLKSKSFRKYIPIIIYCISLSPLKACRLNLVSVHILSAAVFATRPPPAPPPLTGLSAPG